MKRPRATVVCEPFTLDDLQAGALVDAVADAIAEDLIRERDERETAPIEEGATA